MSFASTICMKYKHIFIALFLVSSLVNSYPAFAVPSEIFIIRHADKLNKNPGPALSPKGEIRAIAFAHYFMSKWQNHVPDFIFATNPEGDSINGLYKKGKSIRQIQTVAPLVNILAEKYPNREFPILHPYRNTEYQKLAEDLLTESEFDNKRVLICWDHRLIPELAKKLGVPESELKNWPKHDYDTVYYIKFDGNKPQLTIYSKQYPVSISGNGSWENLYKLNVK